MASVADSPHVVAEFQRAWNHFSRRFGLHYPVLRDDGRKGAHTREAIKKSRYYIAVGHGDWRKNGTDITPELLKTLANPFRRIKGYSRRDNLARRRTASKRRKERLARWKNAHRPHPKTKGLVYLDGKLCAAWIAGWLIKVRLHHVAFSLVSGYRSPEYSDSLCRRMCGQPRCPGLCAGRSSNHSGIYFPRGAADVTNFWAVRAMLARLGAPLTNHLPRDPVHVSNSGY
jgi:hypothetical protein